MRCATLLPGFRGKEESNNDMASNKRRRHTPDQIIRRLAEGNKLLGAGQEFGEVCRHLEIAESTWHRWLAQYGGMKANEAKRLKELEAENVRLKKLVANQALDIDMLKEISAGNFCPRTASAAPSRCCATGSGCLNAGPARSWGFTVPRCAWRRRRSPPGRRSCGPGCAGCPRSGPAGR